MRAMAAAAAARGGILDKLVNLAVFAPKWDGVFVQKLRRDDHKQRVEKYGPREREKE